MRCNHQAKARISRTAGITLAKLGGARVVHNPALASQTKEKETDREAEEGQLANDAILLSDVLTSGLRIAQYDLYG